MAGGCSGTGQGSAGVVLEESQCLSAPEQQTSNSGRSACGFQQHVLGKSLPDTYFSLSLRVHTWKQICKRNTKERGLCIKKLLHKRHLSKNTFFFPPLTELWKKLMFKCLMVEFKSHTHLAAKWLWLLYFNPQGRASLVSTGKKLWCSSSTNQEEYALEEYDDHRAKFCPKPVRNTSATVICLKIKGEKGEKIRGEREKAFWSALHEQGRAAVCLVFKSLELILKFQGNKCNITE